MLHHAVLCCAVQLMKVVAFSFNGVQPIDSNSNFTSEALAAAPGKKFIVMCEAGGTMRQTVNFPMVRSSGQSTALAAHVLAPTPLAH